MENDTDMTALPYINIYPGCCQAISDIRVIWEIGTCMEHLENGVEALRSEVQFPSALSLGGSVANQKDKLV